MRYKRYFVFAERGGFEIYNFSTPIGYFRSLRSQSLSIGLRIPTEVTFSHFFSLLVHYVHGGVLRLSTPTSRPCKGILGALAEII
jgi:hypothetical protein